MSDDAAENLDIEENCYTFMHNIRCLLAEGEAGSDLEFPDTQTSHLLHKQMS